MQIRRINESDGDAVVTLIARNLREVNSRDYPAEEILALVRANDRDAVLSRMKQTHMYVACEGDAVLGCGAVRRSPGNEAECQLLSVFVLPDCHRQGVGRRLMQALEKDEYALCAERIGLHASVTACDFYVKLGYTYQDGRRTVDADGCIRLQKFRHSAKACREFADAE